MNRREKKARKRVEKKRRKEERFNDHGGKTRYALKQAGQIAPEPRLAPVWCAGCYRKVALCACAARRIEQDRRPVGDPDTFVHPVVETFRSRPAS